MFESLADLVQEATVEPPVVSLDKNSVGLGHTAPIEDRSPFWVQLDLQEEAAGSRETAQAPGNVHFRVRASKSAHLKEVVNGEVGGGDDHRLPGALGNSFVNLLPLKVVDHPDEVGVSPHTPRLRDESQINRPRWAVGHDLVVLIGGSHTGKRRPSTVEKFGG